MILRTQILSLIFCSSLLHSESTITITVLNESDTTFVLARTKTNEGAHIDVDTSVLHPHSKTLVRGSITKDVDFAGAIYFNDPNSKLTIRVRRLKHFGQPSFVLTASIAQLMLDPSSLKFNARGLPFDLSYTAATLILKNKP